MLHNTQLNTLQILWFLMIQIMLQAFLNDFRSLCIPSTSRMRFYFTRLVCRHNNKKIQRYKFCGLFIKQGITNKLINHFGLLIPSLLTYNHIKTMKGNQISDKNPTSSDSEVNRQQMMGNCDHSSILFPPNNIQVNINGDIQFMDKIIQSRINRSLVIHGLENLVFEKRQRKSIQPIPPPTPKSIQQPKIPKKKEIPTKKQINPIKIVEKHEKNSKQTSPKIVNKKSVMKKKQTRQKQKRQESEQMIEQEQQKPVIKSKQQKVSKRQRVVQNKNYAEPINIQLESEQAIDNSINRKQLNKRGRGRPKKDLNRQINIIQGQLLKATQVQMPKITLAPPQPALVRQSPQVIKNEMSIEQASDQKQNEQKVNNRQRKAKMNHYKSYNENDDNIFSEEEQVEEREYKRKKKISKNYRNRNSKKPYSLNRIFRKQAKRHFQTFTLDCNLNKVSLPYFIQEFGVFDLIHFSLPISYLNQFPQIGAMIQKGFIFVWAQQGQTQIGYHLLNRWGFDVIDQIVWIKANEDENKIQADNVDICNSIDTSDHQKTRQLFVNCKSTCLVGYKCPLGNKAQYRTKVSNNIIFARALDGIKKPAQIYEIADLMMPGAKKLQFGGEAQKGWLNLNHHQSTLFRCNNCLRQQRLFLLPNQSEKCVQCKRCIINKLKDNAETQQVEQISKLYKQLAKIKISQSAYFDKSQGINCSCCKHFSNQQQSQGFILTRKQQALCKNCFKISKVKQQEVKVLIPKRKVYLKAQLTCSQCAVLNICDIYFQCSKCKNHIVCKNCFWKNKSIDDSNNEGQQQMSKKHQKKETMHEWKLKFIKSYPLTKFGCFGCKKDLAVPFWCCQTCQNWSWCGRCDKGSSQIHPHYQNNKHVEYIMI